MADDDDDKKHPPGGKTLQEALNSGNIPRSPILSGAGTIIVAAMVFIWAGEFVSEPIFELFRHFWAPTPHDLDIASAIELLKDSLFAGMRALAVPMLSIMMTAIVIDLAQTQGHMAWKKLEWNYNFFDPVGGLKNMFFSISPLVELGKSLLKLLAFSLLLGYGLSDRIKELPKLAALPPHHIKDTFIDIGWAVASRAFPIMLTIGAIDYGISYWRWYKANSRTDKQVKDEAKDAGGNPRIKAKIRQRGQEIVYGAILAKMREADVLITNPTHYAIALRYKRDVDAAPIVIAKGVDFTAQRLREEAIRLDIPRIEDRALARGLFRKAKVGKAIPNEFYGPVAKVMAIVFKRRMQRKIHF